MLNANESPMPVSRVRSVDLGVSWWIVVLKVVVGSALIAASAQVTVPMWPVPITAQTLAVLLVAGLLGLKRGMAAMSLYLCEGSVGLPVFAGFGAGIGHLFGPTGGYLLGFVAAAGVVGFLFERGWHRQFITIIAAMTLGTVTIFICGLLWLGFFLPPVELLAVGLVPFLPGAVLKITLAAMVLSKWRSFGGGHERGRPVNSR